MAGHLTLEVTRVLGLQLETMDLLGRDFSLKKESFSKKTIGESNSENLTILFNFTGKIQFWTHLSNIFFKN